jgi:uncharacterized membrane protein (DUF485 family)
MDFKHSRGGLFLFAIYLICYAAYVLVNAFRADLMEKTPVAGINVAILSGMGLILLAFVLAAIYGFMPVTNSSETTNSEESHQ